MYQLMLQIRKFLTRYASLSGTLAPGSNSRRPLTYSPHLIREIVARHTLMKGINMSDKNIQEFAALDNRADPDFIENKGYVFVGHSRENPKCRKHAQPR